MKEKIKSALLFAMLGGALFLTFLNFSGDAFLKSKEMQETAVVSAKAHTYIRPQGFFVGFGGISYSRVYNTRTQEDIWEGLRPFLVRAATTYSKLDTLSKSDYVEAFSGRAIIVRMAADLSLEQWASLYSDSALSQTVGDIVPKEFLFQESEPHAVYVRDALRDTYYRFETEGEAEGHGVDAIIKRIEAMERIQYRRLSDRFSLKNTLPKDANRENYNLIPYAYDYVVPSIRVRNELSLVQENGGYGKDVTALLDAVFEGRRSFIKQLRDINDATIFIYGYGDRSLTLSPGGGITYMEKAASTSQSKSVSFKRALEYATGRLEQLGVIPGDVYLTAVEYIKDEGLYVFSFNYKMNDYAIAQTTPEAYPITVKVQGDRVIFIDKNIKLYAGELLGDLPETIYTVDACLISNYLEVSIYYLQDNNMYPESGNEDAYYFPIRAAISEIDMQYSQSGALMQPVWHVVIGNRVYLFDVYTGALRTTYRRGRL